MGGMQRLCTAALPCNMYVLVWCRTHMLVVL